MGGKKVAAPALGLKDELLSMLSGGSNSVIAIAVGTAEGTRTADGKFTAAWDGHTDPGNGARNQGSFSYQGPATSATDADRKQIEKFKDVLLPRFLELFGGQALTRVQYRILWAIACDCFTQSEVACIGEKGFLELAAAAPTVAQIAELRYQAYWLIPCLRADQERRTIAVVKAIA